MEYDLTFTVPRHCVPVGADGLSPLQADMIRHPARIRIFSAPTGGGKSYAFGRAVKEGSRVLFVVPTRRLAQNLAEEYAKEFKGTSAQVILWTSDERAMLKEQTPDLDIRGLSIRQVRDLDEVDAGTMVLATPESIGLMLLKDRKRAAQIPFYLRDLLGFKHIVFDEFHTISPRGFGLAGALCKIACLLGSGGPRVSFLSATPIDIMPTLIGMGIEASDIHVGRESVETTSLVQPDLTRALHGDVRYRFTTPHDGKLVDTVEALADEIRTCVEGGSQAVVIFDSVASLFSVKERLAILFDSIGIPRERRLAVNSWDDTERAGVDNHFSVGRDCDPRVFDVVIGTASIEIGVTLRSTFLVMDAGFDAASFVQRAGRISRGDLSGDVVVHVPANLDRKGWLTKAMRNLREMGATVTVDEVERAFLEGIGARFKPSVGDLSENIPPTFRTMPQRAIWCAALFWVAMSRADHLYNGQKASLKEFQPIRTGVIQSCLIDLARCDAPAAKAWGKAFLAEALKFRDIAPTVTVVVQGGRSYIIPMRIYLIYSGISSAKTSYDLASNRITVHVDREMGDLIGNSDRVRSRPQLMAMFPNSASGTLIDAENAAEEWLANAKRALDNCDLRKGTVKAMEAAIKLVNLSRLVPDMRNEIPAFDLEGSFVT